jgi:hypothetical protein
LRLGPAAALWSTLIGGICGYRHTLLAAPTAAHLKETTYANIVGPLGEEPTVWAECLFADPVADLAVLGQPDGQELYDESVTYDDLVEKGTLPIASLPLVRPLLTPTLPDALTPQGGAQTFLGPPKWHGRGWLLSLDGRWFGCDVSATWQTLRIENTAEPIRAGMSGSPIVSVDGAAVGVVCLSSGGDRSGGLSPFLWQQLPRWVVSLGVN